MSNAELFETTSYLHIVHNDSVFRGNPFSLFKGFDELRLITYVSSPEFFFENIRGFNRVVAIFGEDDTARMFYQLDPLIEERFIAPAESDHEVLNALNEGRIELRYMRAGERIHSKIYILKNSLNELRVMLGSANFTSSAFGNSGQFEELIVYDSSCNPALCELYLKRFEEIYQNSIDFLSERTRKKISAIVLKADNVIVFTPEDKAELTIEKINKERIAGSNAGSLVVEVTEEKEKLKERIMEIERIERIVEHVTKKTKEGHFFEPKERLLSLREKLKEIVSFSHRRTQEFIDKRNSLHFNPGHSEFYIKHGSNSSNCLNSLNGSKGEHAIPYTLSIDTTELRYYLERLVNFVNSYWEFAVHKDREILKRVFEAILFAFTSPFIYLMRKAVRKEKGEEKIAEIPIVLIIGGLANTGKTKLLLFINKLLGNNFEVFNYRDIYTRSQRVLYDLFYTTNIFPILVDEIYDNFFKGEGERLIKNLTNTLTEPHPCLIGTSNTGFSAESQVIRRIYYLHFGSPFSEDRTLKQRAEIYFEERVGQLDDRLFRYFLKEFIRRSSEEEFFRIEDPLALSRKIFIDFFKKAGLGVPDFISTELCGDYYKIGSIEWQAFYLTKNAEFKEMKDSGERYFVVDLKSIYEPKDAEQLKNRLPPSVVKSSGTPLILHKERFLQFIGQTSHSTWFRFLNVLRKSH